MKITTDYMPETFGGLCARLLLDGYPVVFAGADETPKETLSFVESKEKITSASVWYKEAWAVAGGVKYNFARF
jgi:hypothetical protein